MKILQVTPFFYPAWGYGGPVKIVWELSKKLAENNHQVTVWTTDAYDQKNRIPYLVNKEIRIGKIRVVYFKNLSLWLIHHHKAMITLFLPLYALRNIKKFDLIHLHDFFTMQNIIIYFLAKIYKIPYVISPHAIIDLKRIKFKKTLLKKIYLKLFGKRILKGAHKIFAASDADLIPLRQLNIELKQIKFIHHGINLEDFKQKISLSFRKKFNIPDKSFVMLFLSRLDGVKGLETLIKAFSGIGAIKKDVRLVIAGNDDGYLSNVKNLIDRLAIKERVVLTGPLFEQEKISAYRESDLFVMPSISEGISLVALEAMAAKMPVIISKGCNFKDAEREKAAIIFKEGSTEALKKLLIKMIKNRQLRNIYAKRGFQLVNKKYSFSDTAGSMEKEYQNCIYGK